MKKISLITILSLCLSLLTKSGTSQQIIEGNITCFYGNQGGFCTVESENGEYSLDLTTENKIRWYFNDQILPLTEIAGINIRIPEFEANHLTHFQNCQVKVIEMESHTDLYIYSHQCDHPAESYHEIL